MPSLLLVIPYSDGEGSDAGVGVATWAGALASPEAGRIDIPSDIRRMWSSQRPSSDSAIGFEGSLYDLGASQFGATPAGVSERAVVL